MTNKRMSIVFDYRAFRLLIGVLAFALPIVVLIISSKPLPSISASYHTEARDAFVGILFVISAFLFAYNGHTIREAVASKIAAVATMFVAIFPTSCAGCSVEPTSVIHYVSAGILFVILAYFCLVPFRQNTKHASGKRKRRSNVYLGCGLTIILCIAIAAIVPRFVSTTQTLGVIFWTETIALAAFGIAWFVAGKAVKFLVDDDERLQLPWHPDLLEVSKLAKTLRRKALAPHVRHG